MDRDSSEATRILHAEDSDRDAEIVLHELKRAGVKFQSRRVQTEPEFRRALDEFRPQVILSDYVMPGFSGIAALRICREAGIDIPFIFVSGTIGEDVAVASMKAGADDYVMKTNLIRLGPTVVRALREAELRQGGKVTEAALLRAQTMAKLAHVIVGPDGIFESWSETFPALLGVHSADVPRSTRAWLDLIHPDDRVRVRAIAIEAGRTGKRIEFEYRLKGAGGSWIHISQVSETLSGAADASGRRRWFGTMQDVSEQKRAAESLRTSESLKSAIIEASLDCVVTIDQEGTVVEFNPAAEATFGFKRSEAIGKPMVELIIPPRLHAAHRRGFARYRETGQGPILGKRLELEALRADGTEFPIELAVTDIRSGSQTLFTAFIRDLTERKRVEEDLRRFRLALDNSADIIFIVDRATMRHVDANQGACRLLGYSRQELLGMGPQDLLPFSRHELETAYDALIADPSQSSGIQSHYRCKDGSLLPFESTRHVIRSGNSWLITVISRDIRRRMAAAEKQRAMSQLLDNIVENIPTAVHLKSVADGYRVMMWNKASEQMYGVPRQEAIGKNVHDLWPKALADQFHSADLELIADGRMQDFPDRPAQTRDRGQIRVHMRKVALLDQAGKATHLLVIADDITEQLADQARLRESEERFRSLSQLSSDWFWQQDEQFRFTEFTGGDSPRGWGPDQNSALGKRRWELPGVTPLSGSWDEHIALHEAHRPFRNFEYQHARADGTTKFISASGEPVFDAEGRCTGYRGVATEISERKRAERELLRFRTAMDLSGDSIVLIDPVAMRYIYVNRAACEQTGRSREQLLQMGPQDLMPMDREAIRKEYDDVIAAGEHGATFERRIVKGNGVELWVEMHRSALRTDGGMVIVTISRDITERKRAEQELQRFGRAMDVSPDSIYLTDPATMRFVYLNRTACQRLGYTREELLQKGPQDVFPTPRETIAREFEEVIAAGEPGLIHERLFTRGDGSQGWSELHRRALHTESGTLIVTIGRDITERKRAENVLALEHGVARKLAEADNAREGLQAAMRLVCESEGWDFGRYWRVDQAAQVLRFADAWSKPEADGSGVTEASRDVTFAPGVGLAGKVWQSGEPLWVSNVSEDARVQRQDLARSAGMRGAFVFPVVAEGTIVGVLAFSSRDIRQPDERLLAAVRVIGGQIGQFLRRKEADERVKRLSRVHAVLSGINALIVRVRERDELFREACRIAVEQGGFKMAWIGVADRVAQKVLPVASAGVEAEFITLIKDRFSLREEDPLGNTRTARAVREKKTMVSNEIKDDTLILFSKERQERGIRSMVILPLVVSDSAIGVLALYAGEAGFFDDEELKLLHELAGDIAFAVDHIEKAVRLDYLAYYDQLTGLANRTLFLERVGQSILAAGRAEAKFALAILDIERLRTINDSLGRQAGDAVIKLVAERLAHAAGAAGVSRISADHFALVLGTVKGRSEAGRIMADALRKCFDAPFHVNDTDLRISAKAGVAQFPADGAAAETLLRNAEAALRRGKDGGERITFHSAEMTSRIAESLTLENKLRQALQREEFVLHYQPKVDLDSRRIVGVEALIRWQSPERGLVPPMHFIPLLEETGLIVQAGAWALKRASLDHALWLRQGLNAPRVAVNVSAIQLRQRDFVQVVAEAIAGGADPTAVDIEITESQLMENIAGNIEKLKALRDLGMKISIDDFGTGYSSLGYLASLPVHVLKIDRSFIVAMMKNPDTMTLVSTIISLAHSLRLDVVAEGVEQEDQAKMLRLLRCDQMQGYLISKPVPMEAIAAMLQKPGPG